MLNRVYTIEGPEAGNVLLSLNGPIFRPWTFHIEQRGSRIGNNIKKRWSGLMEKGLSDADNFTAEFPVSLDLKEKKLLLAAVFLIDFVHFENKGRR